MSQKIYFKAVEDYDGRIGSGFGRYAKGNYYDLATSNTAECQSIANLVQKDRLEYVSQEEWEAGIEKQRDDDEVKDEKPSGSKAKNKAADVSATAEASEAAEEQDGGE